MFCGTYCAILNLAFFKVVFYIIMTGTRKCAMARGHVESSPTDLSHKSGVSTLLLSKHVSSVELQTSSDFSVLIFPGLLKVLNLFIGKIDGRFIKNVHSSFRVDTMKKHVKLDMGRL